MLSQINFIKFLFLFCITPLFSFAQSSSNCSGIKNGIFYFYPKNSTDHFVEKREGSILTEINETKSDTAKWKIDWINDCTYSLKFISTTNVEFEKKAKSFKKHKLVYEITALTDDYYVFKGYIDNTTNLPIQNDTIWLNKKIDIQNTSLFEHLANSFSFASPPITDTSNYAILYVYREKKVFLMLSNYLIYFDDNPLCIAKNNSGYIFKIYKEGNFELKSRLYKDESSVKINVKFGNSYYIKSNINWTITNNLYNFKLSMVGINSVDGQSEFEKVKVK